MKPPHCAFCGAMTQGASLVRFADYQPLPERMTGHPRGLEWFCEEHADQARGSSALPLAAALKQMRRRWSR